jgi:hypothetical protein
MRKNYKNIARQIHTMVVLDQKEMRRAKQSGLWNKWLGVTKKNSEKLKIIIKKYGWPTIGLVGKRASRGAWFIVQHSDHDLRFKKRCLGLMKEAWRKNPADILMPNIAFLTDRILANEGKKQLFGTQFYFDKRGKFVPRPIAGGLKVIDKKRSEYGLPPLQDYLEAAREHKPTRVKKSMGS